MVIKFCIVLFTLIHAVCISNGGPSCSRLFQHMQYKCMQCSALITIQRNQCNQQSALISLLYRSSMFTIEKKARIYHQGRINLRPSSGSTTVSIHCTSSHRYLTDQQILICWRAYFVWSYLNLHFNSVNLHNNTISMVVINLLWSLSIIYN